MVCCITSTALCPFRACLESSSDLCSCSYSETERQSLKVKRKKKKKISASSLNQEARLQSTYSFPVGDASEYKQILSPTAGMSNHGLSCSVIMAAVLPQQVAQPSDTGRVQCSADK